MFTGIVQGMATVEKVQAAPGLTTFLIRLPEDKTDGVTIGASVAINGTCLTVTRQEGNALYFDAIQETLRLTTLGDLKPGDSINFERAARIGDEIGGHLLLYLDSRQAVVVPLEAAEPAADRERFAQECLRRWRAAAA